MTTPKAMLRLASWRDDFMILAVRRAPSTHLPMPVWHLTLGKNGRQVTAVLIDALRPQTWFPRPGIRVHAFICMPTRSERTYMHVRAIHPTS